MAKTATAAMRAPAAAHRRRPPQFKGVEARPCPACPAQAQAAPAMDRPHDGSL